MQAFAHLFQKLNMGDGEGFDADAAGGDDGQFHNIPCPKIIGLSSDL